jgi:hypothetical protein
MNLKQNADCVYTSLERVDELKECVHEFFTKYLNHVEESDSGRLFNPVTIGCCRALMLEPLNEVLERMRVLSGADRNPLSTDGIDGARVGEVGIWGEKESNRSQATTSVSISKWVGLTDADIAKAMHGSVEGSNMLPYQFARAVEQALKEKNANGQVSCT